MNTYIKSGAIVLTGAIIAIGIHNTKAPGVDNRTQEQIEFDKRIEADKDDGTYDYDCKDFGTRREAIEFFRLAGGPEYDPYNLDGDEDGIICENFNFKYDLNFAI